MATDGPLMVRAIEPTGRMIDRASLVTYYLT